MGRFAVTRRRESWKARVVVLVSLAYRVHFKCPQCLNQVIVGGVSDQVTCPRCTKVTTMDGGREWYTKEAWVSFPLSEGKASSIMTGDDDVEIVVEKAPVVCVKCQAPFSLDTIREHGREASIACAACGTQMAMRPIPEVFMPKMGLRGVLIGERLEGLAAPTAAPAHAVVIACMSCGGALHIDGKERMVACTFCKADNYLPDPVWARLHPVEQVVRFYLVIATD